MVAVVDVDVSLIDNIPMHRHGSGCSRESGGIGLFQFVIADRRLVGFSIQEKFAAAMNGSLLVVSVRFLKFIV